MVDIKRLKKIERLERAIHNNLEILKAFKEGRIIVTNGESNIREHIYNLNMILEIFETNLLEGIIEPTKPIQKGKGHYEILISI